MGIVPPGKEQSLIPYMHRPLVYSGGSRSLQKWQKVFFNIFIFFCFFLVSLLRPETLCIYCDYILSLSSRA